MTETKKLRGFYFANAGAIVGTEPAPTGMEGHGHQRINPETRPVRSRESTAGPRVAGRALFVPLALLSTLRGNHIPSNILAAMNPETNRP